MSLAVGCGTSSEGVLGSGASSSGESEAGAGAAVAEWVSVGVGSAERLVDGRLTIDWIASIANRFLLLYLLDCGVVREAACGTAADPKGASDALDKSGLETTAAALSWRKSTQDPR